MLADLPLADLRAYRPDVAEPDDFDSFWTEQLAAARSHRAEPVFTLTDSPVRHADVYDVTFAGHGGNPIRGWLLAPRSEVPGAAMIVEFIGYGGGRGHPFDWLQWSAAGHAHLVMDTRGQGGGWRSADTPDPSDIGSPAAPGFVTRGIMDPATHYYTRLFTDAARAVDAARGWTGSAGRPIVTAGASQGGGLAIAAAHLSGKVGAVLADVPFLAHPVRALDVTDASPYRELADFCKVNPGRAGQVFATLSYLDVVNHAKRATAAALFSVGLADVVTPPSTVFAAFNHYAGPKEIAVYPYSGHEGGGTQHFLGQLDFLGQAGLRPSA